MGVELSYNIPLAFGVFRLAKKRIIVKNTNSLEYMAGMNNMITDYYGVAKDQIYIDSIYIEDTQIDQHNIYNLKNMVEPEFFNLDVKYENHLIVNNLQHVQVYDNKDIH